MQVTLYAAFFITSIFNKNRAIQYLELLYLKRNETLITAAYNATWGLIIFIAYLWGIKISLWIICRSIHLSKLITLHTINRNRLHCNFSCTNIGLSVCTFSSAAVQSSVTFQAESGLVSGKQYDSNSNDVATNLDFQQPKCLWSHAVLRSKEYTPLA